MAEQQPVKKKASELECPICLEPFHPDDDAHVPRLLSCAHSICGTCLQTMPNNTGSVLCWCRQSTALDSSKDMKQLKPNFALVELLRRLLEDAKEWSDGKISTVSELLHPMVFCGVCQKAEATIFCYDCPANICQDFCVECFEKEHVTMITGKHSRVPMQQRPPKQVKCKLHKEERVKLYCLQDQELICSDCFQFGAHKNHNAKLIQELTEEVQQEMQDMLAKVTAGVRFLDQKIHADVDQLTAVGVSTQSAIQYIELKTQEEMLRLQQRGQQLIHDVQEESNKRMSLLTTRRNNLAEALAQATAAQEEAQRALSRDPVGLLSARKSAQEHLKTAYEVAQGWKQTHKKITTDVQVTWSDTLTSAINSFGSVVTVSLPPATSIPIAGSAASIAPKRAIVATGPTTVAAPNAQTPKPQPQTERDGFFNMFFGGGSAPGPE